jgi:hypothetical protein
LVRPVGETHHPGYAEFHDDAENTIASFYAFEVVAPEGSGAPCYLRAIRAYSFLLQPVVVNLLVPLARSDVKDVTLKTLASHTRLPIIE